MTGQPLRTRVMAVLALLGALACVLPAPGDKAQAYTQMGSLVVSAVFLTLALARVPPERRAPFRLILYSVLTFLVGEALFTYYRAWRPEVYPTPGDPFLIAAYVPLAMAAWRLDRQRRAAFGGLLDAAIVTASAAVLSIVFLVLPQITTAGLTFADRVVGSSYPLLDVLLMFLVTRMLIAPGGRGAAIWWLIGAMTCTLIADTLNNVVVLRGGTAVPRLCYVFWALFYVCLGLTTSYAESTGSASGPAEPGGLTRRRLMVLAVAAMLPSILLVVMAVLDDPTDALSLGIGSLVLMAMVVTRIWDLLSVLHRQAAELAEVARVDPLTGVANRRSWDFELARGLAASTQAGTVLLVGLLDLDHFKKYNDTRGHQAGDDLLREAAQAWSLGVGQAGRLARWGGEEFAVLLHCPDAETGLATLDALRALVPGGQTCSIGVARWDREEPPDVLLNRADQALYEAKRAGRDRLVSAVTVT